MQIEMKLANSHSLSADEIKKLKKERRAMRNRASATASRQRKKNYLQNLETQLADLQSEQTRLQIRESRLQAAQATRDQHTDLLQEHSRHMQGQKATATEENRMLQQDKSRMVESMRKLRIAKLGDLDSSPHAGMDISVLRKCHALSSSWPPADCVPRYVMLGMAEIEKYHEQKEQEATQANVMQEQVNKHDHLSPNRGFRIETKCAHPWGLQLCPYSSVLSHLQNLVYLNKISQSDAHLAAAEEHCGKATDTRPNQHAQQQNRGVVFEDDDEADRQAPRRKAAPMQSRTTKLKKRR